MINSKLVMTGSAIIMGLAGVALSFLPHEILNYLGLVTGNMLSDLLMQLLGALYFAFAMVNWTAKANLIGGIYGRPIAIGNLAHFTIGVLVLIKGYFKSHQMIVLTLALIYLIFTVLFTVLFFRHPVQNKTN